MDVMQSIRRIVGLNLTDSELEASLRALLSTPDNSIVSENLEPVKEEREDHGDALFAQTLPDDLISVSDAAQKYGYTRAAVRAWLKHQSGIVKGYSFHDDSGPYLSEAEIQEYLQKHGQPAARLVARTEKAEQDKRTEPIFRRTNNHGRQLPMPAAEPMLEWDTVTGASKRLRVKPEMINEMINSGKVESRVMHQHIIVNVRQIEALGRGHRYQPDFGIFDKKVWLPIKDACQTIGIPYDQERWNISDACLANELASRKIGSLRFINVPELERWYLSRG